MGCMAGVGQRGAPTLLLFLVRAWKERYLHLWEYKQADSQGLLFDIILLYNINHSQPRATVTPHSPSRSSDMQSKQNNAHLVTG